jgi:Flp pilus assembly protein TadD
VLDRVYLATLLSDRARFGESVSLYREVIPALERSFGPEHSNTLSTLNNLAVTLNEAGDPGGAAEIQRRILEIRRRNTPGGRSQEVASVLQNLALSYAEQGRHAEAERHLVEAHEIYLEVLPDGHYLTAFPLLTRASIQLDTGNAAGAEESARESTRILRSSLPPGHYATASAECRLGGALAAQGRFDEARALIDAALPVLEANDQTPGRLLEECTGFRGILPV